MTLSHYFLESERHMSEKSECPPHELYENFLWGGLINDGGNAYSGDTETQIDTLAQNSALKAIDLIKEKEDTGPLRILELGCGRGALSSRLITHLAKKSNASTILLDAIDKNSFSDCIDNQVFSCYQSRLEEQKWVKGEVRIKEGISEIDYTRNDTNQTLKMRCISFDLNENTWYWEHRGYDVVLALFVLHLLKSYRDGVKKILKIQRKNNGKTVVMLSELVGDYAGWSRCFHKVKIKSEENNHHHIDNGRVKAINFMRRLCNISEKYFKLPNTREVCASEIKPILSIFEGNGVPVQNIISQKYQQKFPIGTLETAWNQYLNAKVPGARPFLSVLPRHEDYSTEIEQEDLYSMKDQSLKKIVTNLYIKDCGEQKRSYYEEQLKALEEAIYEPEYNIYILQTGIKNHHKGDDNKHISTQNYLLRQGLDVFSTLRSPERHAPNQNTNNISADVLAKRLIDGGLISGQGNITIINYEYDKNLTQGRWGDNLPIIGFDSKPEGKEAYGINYDHQIEILKRQCQFFTATRRLQERSKQPATLTELLYSKIPEKIILEIYFDANKSNMSWESQFKKDGHIKHITLHISANCLSNKGENFTKQINTESIKAYDKSYTINTLLKSAKVDGGICPPSLESCLDEEINNKIRKMIEKLFDTLSYDGDTKLAELLSNQICLASISGFHILHIPAATLEDNEKSQRQEIAHGGIIVTSKKFAGESEKEEGDFYCDASAVQHCLELHYRGMHASWHLQRFKKTANVNARTAILARNFSHILGSHVVSNPSFREALLGRDWRDYRRGLQDCEKRLRLQSENLLARVFDSGDADDISTVWMEAEDRLREADEALFGKESWLEHTRIFHEYLQGRFDYIARAIDDSQDMPQPVFLVSEALEGFLKQTAFLATLTKDLGLTLPDMRISVVFKKEKKQFHSEWKSDENKAWKHDWIATTGGSDDISRYDLLLGLPGGLIATHALYAMLENIIRNSVKHGTYRDDEKNARRPYCLFIVIDEAKPKREDEKPNEHLRGGGVASGLEFLTITAAI
jgi:hypothetical protein